jgi:hypothetical protein
MSTIVVTDDTTAQEIREAVTNLAHYAMRMPAHWTDRRAETHRRINTLLDELDKKA